MKKFILISSALLLAWFMFSDKTPMTTKSKRKTTFSKKMDLEDSNPEPSQPAEVLTSESEPSPNQDPNQSDVASSEFTQTQQRNKEQEEKSNREDFDQNTPREKERLTRNEMPPELMEQFKIRIENTPPHAREALIEKIKEHSIFKARPGALEEFDHELKIMTKERLTRNEMPPELMKQLKLRVKHAPPHAREALIEKIKEHPIFKSRPGALEELDYELKNDNKRKNKKVMETEE